ncbi:MAG: 6-bladed beta-propeller [Candidatus Thorarchaeota archaeon]
MFIVFVSCEQRKDNVEKILEDGVEVIINHLEPYKIKGEPTSLKIEVDFTIDTERDDVATTGLTDITHFDVDSEGYIYCLNGTSNEDFIVKFDKDGKFIISFGRKGQGPGELNRPYHVELNHQEQIVITDYLARKLILFDKDGNYIKEYDRDLMAMKAHPLANGKYLVWYQLTGQITDEYIIQTPLSLRTSDLEEIKELDRYKLPNYRVTGKRRGIMPSFSWAISKKYIFIGNETRDYEIWAFDLEGNLVKKIRTAYSPVIVPDEYKKDMLDGIKFQEMKEATYFPKNFPPFRGMFADDTDRLYVMTYEKDADTDESIFDIFSPEGFFLGQIPIKVIVSNSQVLAKITGKSLYCVKERRSGYKELVVYKMTWE